MVTWQTDFQQAELTCSQAVTIVSTTSSVDSVPEHYDRSVRVDVQPRTRSGSADDERHRSTWRWPCARRGILRDHKIDLGSARRFHADAADAQTATRNPIACHVDCESRQCRHFRILRHTCLDLRFCGRANRLRLRHRWRSGCLIQVDRCGWGHAFCGGRMRIGWRHGRARFGGRSRRHLFVSFLRAVNDIGAR